MRWLAALAALTLVRLVLCAILPLAPDEAYYWVWSRDLQGGYLDHPPMVALFIRAGTLLAGETPARRAADGPALPGRGLDPAGTRHRGPVPRPPRRPLGRGIVQRDAAGGHRCGGHDPGYAADRLLDRDGLGAGAAAPQRRRTMVAGGRRLGRGGAAEQVHGGAAGPWHRRLVDPGSHPRGAGSCAGRSGPVGWWPWRSLRRSCCGMPGMAGPPSPSRAAAPAWRTPVAGTSLPWRIDRRAIGPGNAAGLRLLRRRGGGGGLALVAAARWRRAAAGRADHPRRGDLPVAGDRQPGAGELAGHPVSGGLHRRGGAAGLAHLAAAAPSGRGAGACADGRGLSPGPGGAACAAAPLRPDAGAARRMGWLAGRTRCRHGARGRGLRRGRGIWPGRRAGLRPAARAYRHRHGPALATFFAARAGSGRNRPAAAQRKTRRRAPSLAGRGSAAGRRRGGWSAAGMASRRRLIASIVSRRHPDSRRPRSCRGRVPDTTLDLGPGSTDL